jgi:hypothetical protein
MLVAYSIRDIKSLFERRNAMKKEKKHPDLSVLLKEFPPYVQRNHPRLKELTGYSGRTMANMDCLGQTAGVKKIMLGNTTAYERESLVAWLETRSRILPEGGKRHDK